MSRPAKRTKTKPAKTKTIRPKLKTLSLKQSLFVDNYTDISNPTTFGNKTQSYKHAYPNAMLSTAQQNGFQQLNKPKIVEAVEQRITAAGIDSKVRLNRTASILNGDYIQKTTSTTKKGNKILYKTSTEKNPSAREVLAAVDLIEKISGTYDKNKAKADVMSQELKGLIRKARKDMDQ